MRYFIKYKDGKGISFITSLSSREDVPLSYDEVTGDQYQAMLSDLGKLPDVKDYCLTGIDDLVGQIRKKYSTCVNGQSEIYIVKSQEAREIKQLNYDVVLTDYPFIAAEVEVTGDTLQNTVDLILTTEKQWKIKASEIEKVRREAKIKIKQCPNVSEVYTAYNYYLRQIGDL